jgi:phosphatidyl-myo-inositol dimannoside synthase
VARILLLTHEFPPFHGGIGTYARQMAAAAHRLGHSVTVSAPDYGRDLASEDRDRYPFRLIRFRGGPYAERRLPALVLRDLSLVRGEPYDVVHAVDWPNALALGLANRVRRTPFIATVYGTEVLGSARSRLAAALGARRLFEVPDRLLAISEFTKRLLLDHFPRVDERRVAVTPLGVSPFWFDGQAEAPCPRAEYGIPRDARVVLTASRLDPRKGHRLALRALALLPESLREGLAYVVVGDGASPEYLRELRSLADACGVTVVFTGGVSDEALRALYRTASVFCMPGEPHPKKVEGFGLVFLEAAAQGLPAITSDVGAAAEVVRHEATGLVVPPMDESALASALARLLRNEALRSGLGRNARESAEAFTWERCAAMTYGHAEAPIAPDRKPARPAVARAQT